MAMKPDDNDEIATAADTKSNLSPSSASSDGSTKKVTFLSSLLSKSNGSKSDDGSPQRSPTETVDIQRSPIVGSPPANSATDYGSTNNQKAPIKKEVPTQQEIRRSMDFVEEQVLTHVYRQIPERGMFSKGCGVFGYFEVTTDALRQWGDANFFGKSGRHVSTFVRFSGWNGSSGSAETLRDLRGFSVRFYTDEGNFDLIGTNLPVFFIRNPSVFPALVTSLKRNPATNLRDANAVWSFFASNPESVHALMMLYSERGLPSGYRNMVGFGCHAYKLVNKQGEVMYAKFSWRPKNGVEILEQKDADRLAATDPDHFSRELYTAVASGELPVWDLCVQLMSLEQAKKLPFCPFDCTKVWPQKAFPLQVVGSLTVNHNPTDYFADVEQVAFNPGNLIPGVEPSPDPMFQQRLSIYPKSSLYRIGRNYHQLTVNKESDVCRMKCMGNSRCVTTLIAEEEAILKNFHDDTNHYAQPKIFWSSVLDSDGRKHLCACIAADLKDADAETQSRMVEVFSAVHQSFGKMMSSELDKWKAYLSGDFSSLFYQGIESISQSTPNLMSLTSDSRDKKAAGKGRNGNSGDNCKKIREMCHMQ